MDDLKGNNGDMNSQRIFLRRLRDDEADYRLLDGWCSQEEIYRYFEQHILSPEEIRQKYRPRTREDAAVPVYMIENQGRPVGIVQYHRMVDADGEWCGIREDGAYEIDLFIGEAEARGRGIGRSCVELIGRHLFDEKGARMLVMCPVRDNVRAVRCYRRCGFEENRRFSAPDTLGKMQEYVYMTRTKQEE